MTSWVRLNDEKWCVGVAGFSGIFRIVLRHFPGKVVPIAAQTGLGERRKRRYMSGKANYVYVGVFVIDTTYAFNV